nr:hypothetical protein [Tanacetum cinerariifolium]
MSTQQDIYAAGSENRPPMLNQDNYVPWSSRIIRYARSKPNGKMIVDTIENGPYVRRMIATPGEPDPPVPEKFTSTDKESIESYYHRFMQLMNDLKRNKHFPENIASNLEFINNLQPKWKRHVTIVRQTKNLHEADFTQYDFLNMNQDEDRQSQNVGGNGGNQFGQYARQVAHNQQGYNAWQNGGIQYAQNAVQNSGVQSGGNQNGLVVIPGIVNQSGTGNVVAARAEGTGIRNQARCYNCRGLGHIARNCTVRPRRRDASYLHTQVLIAQKEEQASTSGTQHDKAPVYDTDDSAKYTDLIEPIPEPQLVPQNDNHVTFVAPSMVQSRGTVETSFAPNEETRAHQETIYRNLVEQVTQVNMVNCNMRATNAELKSELARYKIQEQHVEISQEKYDKLEKCYQKSVYQE